RLLFWSASRNFRCKALTLISHILFENYRSVDMRLFYMSVVLWLLSACRVIRSTCHELLFQEDAEFCKGGLKVIYPDLIIDKCLIVPQKVREKISKEWGPPQVQLPGVKEFLNKVSVLCLDKPCFNCTNPGSVCHDKHIALTPDLIYTVIIGRAYTMPVNHTGGLTLPLVREAADVGKGLTMNIQLNESGETHNPHTSMM
ncbi:putative phosphatidylethanolamine-binding protein 4, partial [Triplophysa rosa]